MSNRPNADAPPTERREQPFLYQWNRRLRHLHGISLRNLNLSPTHGRSRGKTIADDDSNLRTPARALIHDEARTLQHARSYDQLLKTTEDFALSPPRALTTNENDGKRPRRPVREGMRRRSTLHWGSSNPRTRQLKLEAVEENRLVTSWFSIHHEELEQPIYVSEVMEQSMNPSFSFFDLDTSISQVARSDTLLLRVWSKNELMDEYHILVELNVNLRSLQFIGRSLENFHHPLPENCVLLHLSDGIYTSFTDLPVDSQPQLSLTAAMRATTPIPAASFDMLIKLANLDDVIQDALRTRAKLEADINKLLEKMPSSERALSRLSAQREECRNVKRACEGERKHLDQSSKTKTELHQALKSRRDVIESLPAAKQKADDAGKQLQAALQKVHRDLEALTENTHGQVRRISTSLLQILPIEPIKNKTLQFTVRNVHLPNSNFSDTNQDEIAAALAYTAQFVYRLALYLSVPLPYPIELHESTPLVRDAISAGIAQRRFPLHPAGAVYKFEYGVFLLNKDIEFLMNRSGLRVMDIRHTLPNLKYLMFVLTTGSGDLPNRKAGGIRGLLRGRITPNMSRRNSDDSVTSQASAFVSDKHGNLAQQEKMSEADDVFNGPLRAKGLPYRKSMLRDAG